MKKTSSQKRKNTDEAAAPSKKQLIGIALGVVAVIVIAAIAYFAWPKPPSVTELQIEDIVVGTGREAKEGDTVTLEYTGWLEGGAKSDPVDSSYDKDEPFQFVLGDDNILPGWNQGVAGMRVGGKRKLTIPPHLAYGAAGGGGGKVPPNAVVIFEIEMVDVRGRLTVTLPPTTVSELKIEDLVVGTGAEAKTGDTVVIHYTGWLEDGSEFDSSLHLGEPIEFVLGQGDVIDGWEQGLLGMKAGGKRKLTVPPHLGYGAKGLEDFVPPQAALIFEVELLEIK